MSMTPCRACDQACHPAIGLAACIDVSFLGVQAWQHVTGISHALRVQMLMLRCGSSMEAAASTGPHSLNYVPVESTVQPRFLRNEQEMHGHLLSIGQWVCDMELHPEPMIAEWGSTRRKPALQEHS